MSSKIDMTGEKLGKLTVIVDSGLRNKRGSILWLCKCDCGKQVKRTGDYLRRKKTPSCGCAIFKHRPFVDVDGILKKWCNVCHKNKSIKAFAKAKNRYFGFEQRCRQCGSTYCSEYLHKKGGNKTKRDYRRKNPIPKAEACRMAKKCASRLTDGYIRGLLSKHSNLKASDFDDINILELKRAQVRLQREAKK